MIGVLAKPGQARIVEEFFEFFKTPWQPFDRRRHYTVVVTTTGDVPEGSSTLVVAFGSEQSAADARAGILGSACHPCGALEYAGANVPIYGEILTFTGSVGEACLDSRGGIAGVRYRSERTDVLRIGYDLFEEVRFILTQGQPVAHASIATLDLHIALLRTWILGAGVPLVEIPPIPAGRSFCVCLTHDIDFIGIRQHRFDHSMWGFLYRSTIGGVRDFLSGRINRGRLAAMWRAALSLPFVYAGWVRDFWEPFGWYARVESGLPATYFLIPFKHRPGDRVPGPAASRRATAYDITDVSGSAGKLARNGCEIGVHGIDAWHSAAKGREELSRVEETTGNTGIGVRMHWLLSDEHTFAVLDEAGFAYDSTGGYNETIGFRHGTTQVFRPIGARRMLELPLHIQDGALFSRRRLNLSEDEAAILCDAVIAHAERTGGVVTVLWHDRSHAPERLWGQFYIRLLERLRSRNAWFGTAAEIVEWFRHRRAIRFETHDESGRLSTSLHYEGTEIRPPVTIRLHRPATGGTAATFVDRPWTGATAIDDLSIGRHVDFSHRDIALTCAVQ